MTDRADAIAAMADHGETVRDRAAETAIARLEATGEVDDADREAVEALADRLVEGILGGPMAEIATGDEAAVAAALALFEDEIEQPPATAADRAAAGD